MGPKGVAETTPNPPLGVVLATPLAPWGRPSHPLVPKGVAVAAPGFFFFFLFLKNIFFLFLKKKKKNLIKLPRVNF
jgi:hypothetical protein